MSLTYEVLLKGKKGGVRSKALLNSGSDVVILPKQMAQEIGPEPAGVVLIELADGRVVRRKAYEVEVELRDEKGKIRRVRTEATIEDRECPVLGSDAMRKLGIILNMKEGKVSFA
jgi:predicted aspartyl protease